MDWHQLWEIALLPDNIPILLMIVLVPVYTWYALRQARANDRLIEQLEADPELAKTHHRTAFPYREGWPERVHVWPYLLKIQRLAQNQTDWDLVALRKRSLLRTHENPGPSLKDVRAKLMPEWIPVWLRQPRDFRPATRMPNFRLTEDQSRAIAAFLWQAAEEKQVPHEEQGDSGRGKELFETRGCQACHSVDGKPTFAATLGRLAEKTNYDYLVEWIRNPLEGAIMPDLWLTEEEARDIATYLTEQGSQAAYPPADYLIGKALFDEGRELVKHFGCFGCHEISGMQNYGRVATDLTQEGSKPIERLDSCQDKRLISLPYRNTKDWSR